jgi:hypothetical protein
LAGDNDSGLGRDAYLPFTPSTSGYYYVTASSAGGDIGTYTIQVNVAPKHFAGDHIPVDQVAAEAVDALPTFLGGGHLVGLPSVQALASPPNLTTAQALLGSPDNAALNGHDASMNFAPAFGAAPEQLTTHHTNDWLIA